MTQSDNIIPAVEIQEDRDVVSQYDPELRFRQLTGITLKLTFYMTLVLSLFHIYTAGFGVLQEWRHRAFHLAFVLPLVFFLYTIRKETVTERKHFFYDLLYGAIGGMLSLTIFREFFGLMPFASAVWGLASFGLIFYFKRRNLWNHPVLAYSDFVIFTAMLGLVAFVVVKLNQAIDFQTVFRDPNKTLIFWSVFLFVVCLLITTLFVLQWVWSLRGIVKGSYNYQMNEIPYFDVFCALLASIVSVYIFLEFNALVYRAGMPTHIDMLMGAFAVLLVLEGTRRSIGAPLAFIAVLVLINCYLGPYFLDIPGLSFFAHRGYTVERIIEHMYLGTEGIFGIPLGVVATFVFHFVLFGIFISKTGLGQLFIDLAMALAGGTVGGPAKVSVISSGFLGSISGSSIANTVTTGAFTIPLMKKVGYKPTFAGAVEAAASTGGQLMPPIMGAAAFIMAEFLGIPYIKIAACAIVPSFLHFFAVGTMVHFEALKQGLMGLPKESLPRAGQVLRERGLLITPLAVIVYLLISGSSPFLAAYWGIIFSVSIGQMHKRSMPLLIPILLSMPPVLFRLNPMTHSTWALVLWVGFAAVGLIWMFTRYERRGWLFGCGTTILLIVLLTSGVEATLSSFFTNMAIIASGITYKESKMRFRDILDTLEWGTKNALAIGAACASVGFIVGATTLTGLGLKFASAVIELASGVASFFYSIDFTGLMSLSGNTLFFTLVFTAISCFVLGMGIPTTAQYIIASMIAAPALMQFGIHPLISHMFVLFYAVLADVTPPVALAAYAASGISGGDPFRSGFTAFALSSAKIYVPFAFVYSPIILWMPWILDPTAGFNYMEFITVFATVVAGVVFLGATIIGYFKAKSTIPERLGTGIAALCMLIHENITSVIGIALMVIIYLIQRSRVKRESTVSPA
ncbi:TRAP transporter permease [bacterium]|nr:TRAP transporter permease [bacterium]